MLDRINTYFSKSKKYILNQKLTAPQGLCCIHITPKEFTFVYMRPHEGKNVIELCESSVYNNNKEFLAALTALVKKHQLKNVSCSVMLNTEDYQLILTDPLPVTKEEFQTAIRWKIKDLLRYPGDDVLIDSFHLPKMKTNQNKIMAATAQASKMKMLSDDIESCGLRLKYIDIPEFALFNLINLYEQPDKSTLLIYVHENAIQLMIGYQKELFVFRVLKVKIKMDDMESVSSGIDRLISEIHRSFDYYQSIWDHPIPSQFVFSSTRAFSDEAIQLLSDKIHHPIVVMNINDALKANIKDQGKYLLVIGGALREQTPFAQAINFQTLLPKKSRFAFTPKNASVAYGGFAVLLILIHWTSLWQKHELTRQYDELNNQVSLAQQQLNSLTGSYPITNIDDLKKSIEQLQSDYDSKVKVIDLLSPYANFSSYLLGLAGAIVPGVWLTDITFDRGKDKISLNGHALDPAILEKFYNNLTTHEVFSNLVFEVKEVDKSAYPASFFITAKQVNKT